MDGLIRFVREGGGLAGLHGASFASLDVPEFGELIGAQDGPHQVETATLKIDDPDSPLTRQFASSPLTAPLWAEGLSLTFMSFITFCRQAPTRATNCMYLSVSTMTKPI